MKKIILGIIILASCGTAFAQQTIGLPTERIALPAVQGSHLICIWDHTADAWYTAFVPYDHTGQVVFQVPEWGKWYWIGLWNESSGEYAFGKWVGHFIME